MAREARNSGRTASNVNPYEPSGPPFSRRRRDIRDRGDVVLLVERFYTEAFTDELIGHIFTDVVHMDLTKHLPIMADFWQTVLFRAGLYSRNVLAVHLAIHAKQALTPEHFNRWLELWSNTVDALFAGGKAELAKAQAHVIAGSIHRRVTGQPASQYETIAVRPEAAKAAGAAEL